MLEAAEYLGVDATGKESYLKWIVSEFLNAPLPDGWLEVEDDGKNRSYYFNIKNGASRWDHPLIDLFRSTIAKERIRYDKLQVLIYP